ncbi:MAG: 2-dehydro-3-deoxygalactonokinase, partial [Enterobacteriaceae bacterium]
WLEPGTLVVMAGMVGSNVGWKNAPYLPCPVALPQIAHHLAPVQDNIWIVPGLSVNDADNHDVMRGEETQVLGAWQLQPAELYIMPGTHCKWVALQEDKITTFHTSMTGELHYLLLNHSLIGAGLPAQSPDWPLFLQGLERGLQDDRILSRLFEVRAAQLLAQLNPASVSEFLSGLLIGCEVAEMSRYFIPSGKVTLIADSVMAQRYQAALERMGINSSLISADEALQAGIRSIVDELAK